MKGLSKYVRERVTDWASLINVTAHTVRMQQPSIDWLREQQQKEAGRGGGGGQEKEEVRNEWTA